MAAKQKEIRDISQIHTTLHILFGKVPVLSQNVPLAKKSKKFRLIFLSICAGQEIFGQVNFFDCGWNPCAKTGLSLGGLNKGITSAANIFRVL